MKKKQEEPVEEPKEEKGKFHGHKRYTVCLQSTKEKCMYDDYTEKDTFADACDTAKACAEREGRPCIVYDRRPNADPVVYRTGV